MISGRSTKFLLGSVVLAGALILANSASGAPSDPSIVEIAAQVNEDTGEFSTLISALDTAGLLGVLGGNRQFTVFAPVDAAFAELDLDEDSIKDVPVDTLTDILLYHVSPGRRLSTDILDSERVRTMNKSFTFPSITEEGAFINDAQLIPELIDIEARNGVIHVIDGVLLPGMAASNQAAVPEPASASIMLGLLCCLGIYRHRLNAM